ncbi:MAG: hypothetical protein IKT47_01255 [Oscillospiraceae bacterium]|nr:hypothetical protein [Oscillospiraceae bacterium]
MKLRKLLILFLSAVLLFSLCACASEPVVLSESEITALRETYPTIDTIPNGGISFEQAIYSFGSIVIAEVSGDWETSYSRAYLPLTVEKVLYENDTLSQGDEIRIFQGSTQLSSFEYYDVKLGGRYIFFISPGQDNSAYYDDSVFGGSITAAAYITEGDYVLPTAENGPFAEQEGYALASYEEVLPKLIKAAQKANENKTREEILYAE